MTIEVLTKKPCVQCDATKRTMKKHKIDFTPRDMDADASLLEYAKSLGHLQAPVVLVKDAEGNLVKSFAGFNPEAILALKEEYAAAPVAA